MWTQRTGALPRRSSAADVHQAGVVGRHADLGAGLGDVRDLVGPMAVDTSAFFKAKVPPKPQHSSLRGSVDELETAHCLQQPHRLVDRGAASAASGRTCGA